MDSTDAVIAVEHLTKRFGDVTAVADVTLRVERGEIFGFLGPNGAGKTTSVKMLLGLCRPSGGRARVLGRPLGDRSARARIGYLPELFRYHEWLSAREELHFHAGLAGIPPRERSREIARVLDLVGLASRAESRIGTFSKGMQQRVGLAVALLGTPDLVILDEPTSALDPVGRRDVREMLLALREHGTAVFLNSHLLSEVEQICSHVAIVDRGRVVADGRVEDLINVAPRVRVVALANGTPLSEVLARFGSVAPDGDAYVVTLRDADAVPEIARALVASGAAIHAITPLAGSLEARFLELVTQQ
ncbi:MAG: ABC transporter ATP-binding protein [bacterium]|nr:ABC transporter ATP-binding protein [bacterium]